MTVRLVLAATLATVASAWALDPAGGCCAAKLRSSGIREKQLFRCHAKAAAHGVAVDPACVAAVGDALARGFARAEGKGGCPGIGDAGLVESDLDRIVTGIAAAMRPVPTASACAARKLKAAGRLAASALRAFAREAPHPGDHLDVLDPVVTELSQRMQDTFLALEGASPCLTTGDAATISQAILVGSSAPFVVDGVLLTSFRLCPVCGDNARGGAEECDGFDAFECNGPCHPDCTCASCGDGDRNQPSEQCDGDDAAECQALCQPDCTCPTPVCGNGVKEAGEECDGAALGTCGSGCQADCTCPPPTCGNAIIEEGEQCEGSVCAIETVFADCVNCQCCDGGMCGLLGCCDGADACLIGPGGVFGSCAPVRCRPDHPCGAGYTCVENPFDPSGPGICAGSPGSVCQYITTFFACLPPSICPASGSLLAVCCLPDGETCGANGDCCSGTCTANTCG
jgi:hypothetical protein